eukprot:TRINITY_DN2077_c0_g1_i1.p1 TRINITY_DN2077_c0_g1~~TRINITY_DN2077_c0_g1_i1.p1  ORF type:complete len:173 (-),score=62.51 TRINITY_DN2077_c0_g1_i1:120-638(-)
MASIAGVSAPHPGQHVRGPPPLGPFNPNKLHSDPERFICIYPAYLNSKKSVSEGRRLPMTKAVENPAYQEIKMVLDDAGYELGKSYVLEGKFYPRERSKEPMFRGRFKIQLKQSDGELLKEEFPTRDSIMVYLGEKIPLLKHRVNPPKGAAGGEQPQTQGNQGGQKKKKGKK